MTQEQFDSLEKLLKSIKYVNKELINDKAFNEVVCEILNIQTDVFVSADDYKPLKNIKFNEENPEMKKISENLIEEIEKNAAKYNSGKDNLKERFIEVSNKCNDLIKLNNNSWKK